MGREPLTFITLCVLVLARTIDLAVTFHFSPTLGAEGNPIFLLVGGGRVSLLLFTSIFPILAIGFLIVLWRGNALAWNEPPATLRAFVRGWLERVVFDRQPLTAYFSGQTHASEGIQAIRLFGCSLSWALIFGSAAAVYAWAAAFSFGGPKFLRFFSLVSIGRFSLLPAIFAVFGGLFGALLFFLSDFALLKNSKN